MGYVSSDSEQMSGPYTKRARVQYVDVADKAVQCNFGLSPVAGSSDEVRQITQTLRLHGALSSWHAGEQQFFVAIGSVAEEIV